ncbi:MAG: ATP-binding protein [Phenylobacterium sp.]|nr:MAG: ATP-binding protein [Phenylobacterium sp.]
MGRARHRSLGTGHWRRFGIPLPRDEGQRRQVSNLMSEKLSFLTPDTSQIRHQIKGVLESYSHEWDILAELSQNAVDAIVRATPTRGHIELTVNAQAGTIEIQDNGVGIAPADLLRLLRPFASDKGGHTNQIGQKGVGLTFVLFSTVSFELETHEASGSATAAVHGASSWANSDDNTDLLVEVGAIATETAGTRIKIKLADHDLPLFDLTFAELTFALRTRTALGSTNFIWGEPLNCDVKFSHIDRSGNANAVEFDCNYLLPTEKLKSDDYISVDDYLEWRSESDRSDAEKRRKLKDRIVYFKGKKYQAGRDIKYWSCFVPNRAVWQTLSELHGLSVEHVEDDMADGDDMFVGFKFSGGLSTSSKGMPTGIFLELKPRGSAGYFPNFFIIVEDPSLSFDIGRKSIQGRQQGMLREIAYEEFRRYVRDFVKYISGSIDDPDPSYDREELFAEIASIAELDSSSSKFAKRPNSQEATVAAMFFEQLGAGQFSSFVPLISGYRGRYDLYGKIGAKSQVVEFKFDLSGLFRDFSDERKMFDEINTVVLWEITEKDRSIVSKRGLTLTEIGGGLLTTTNSKFPGAHFRLNLDGVKSIEIVSMRKILKPGE